MRQRFVITRAMWASWWSMRHIFSSTSFWLKQVRHSRTARDSRLVPKNDDRFVSDGGMLTGARRYLQGALKGTLALEAQSWQSQKTLVRFSGAQRAPVAPVRVKAFASPLALVLKVLRLSWPTSVYPVDSPSAENIVALRLHGHQ